MIPKVACALSWPVGMTRHAVNRSGPAIDSEEFRHALTGYPTAEERLENSSDLVSDQRVVGAMCQSAAFDTLGFMRI